ncbi:MAG: SusC/RagA family TonB-linked outer membrane protein [candidate division KSB1 bacterium]|nr:SusC/RagA family TonB-linked outer membrane protein [candidate division KSB1 bacterium]MDZ7368742.1 SusC/RagA family TonB-linked outer membrane protein [candidate division KSB1 bacterium]MDZ7406441.1 SusC/RagA family TonB-linked outer membrane protein [candidate division KSB1 bacterium]
MVKRITVGLSVLVLSLLVANLAFAQRGTIAGKVTDAKSGQGLPGANVLVQGLDYGAATNVDGEFTITGVPAGTHSVIARFIGYKSVIKQVTVTGGGIAELNFSLTETALQLDEVVVTGSGVAAEKKKLGNTVATINNQLIQEAPVSTLSEILQGREAGVQALPSGGLVGEGTRLRIRGTSSLSQTNEPVVYVDGIRVDNAGGFVGVGAGGGGVPSRLDDINPDAIERVEILKGAAAATLYGTQASAGVIQIFTKQGSFSKPKFSLEIEQAAITYPDVYKPNAGFARNDAQLANMRTAYNDPGIQLYQVIERRFVNNLFGTGYGQTYSLGVSGGGSGVTYFANARYQNTNGPFDAKPEDFFGQQPGIGEDKLNRAQFSATLGIVPSNKLNIRLSSNYSRIRQETIDNNNNIYGVISLAMFGKPERVVPPNAAGQGNAMGNAAFSTVREATYQETTDATDHATASLSTSYKLTNEIALDGTFGIDYVSQRSTNLNPFGNNVDAFVTNFVDGYLGIGKREHTELTLDVKGSWNRNFTSTISSSFVAGLQGFITNETYSAGYANTFPGPGIEVLQGGATRTSESSFLEVVQAGYFFQEQLGYRDYLYLTGGVRFDANSAFGSNFSTVAYPKASLSFVPSQAFNLSSTPISTLRLRAAIGQSGQQPGAFDKFTTFVPFTSTDGAGLSPGNLGNQDLKPEVATEWELGFEAGVFNDRLGLEFTYWDKTIRDALVSRAYAPSGGFYRRQLDNIGELKAHGIDLEANVRLLKKENLSVEVFANGAFLREKITDLGGAPALKTGGSYPRYRNFLELGFAPAAFLGAKLNTSAEYPIDLNRDLKPETREALLAYFSQPRDPGAFFPLVVDEDGDGNILDHYLGKPTPDWQGAFGLNLGFMKRFRLASLFEYKAGEYFVHNLTDEFRRFHAVIGRNTRRAAELEAILINPASTAEQRLAAADEWARKHAGLSPYDGLNAVEKADFIRWRELSLTYDIPQSIFSRFGVGSASITLAGRNLALFTGYSGIDPETNAIGRGTGGGLDTNFLTGTEAFGLPIPRQVVFTLRTGF